jgi:hypothetical protein
MVLASTATKDVFNSDFIYQTTDLTLSAFSLNVYWLMGIVATGDRDSQSCLSIQRLPVGAKNLPGA